MTTAAIPFNQIQSRSSGTRTLVSFGDFAPNGTAVAERYVERNALKQEFDRLCGQWRAETAGLSSPFSMAMHPAYQQIIGMGRAALSLILMELRDHGGDWYWALASITREDPVSPQIAGKTQQVKKAWLDWGEQNNYLSA